MRRYKKIELEDSVFAEITGCSSAFFVGLVKLCLIYGSFQMYNYVIVPFCHCVMICVKIDSRGN